MSRSGIWLIAALGTVGAYGCGSPSGERRPFPTSDDISIRVRTDDFLVVVEDREVEIASFFERGDARSLIEKWGALVRASHAADTRKTAGRRPVLELTLAPEAKWWGLVEEVAYAFAVAVADPFRLKVRLDADTQWVDVPFVRREDADNPPQSLGLSGIDLFLGWDASASVPTISSPGLKLASRELRDEAVTEFVSLVARRCPGAARPVEGTVASVSITYKVGTDKRLFLARHVVPLLRRLLDGSVGCIGHWEIVPFSWR